MKFEGIKEQGSYTTGVGVDFLHFQRTLMDLPVGSITSCLTSDKIQLELEVKLQVRMQRYKLISVILEQFGDKETHEGFMKRLAHSIITATCLEFKAEDYYLERSTVDSQMFANLVREINSKDFGVKVEFFQLNHIQLPGPLVEVLTEKQNIAQQIITAHNDRENKIITATTALLEAEQEAQVLIIQANNTATIIEDRAIQREEVITTEWDNRAIAYAAVVDALSLNERGFLEYLNSELLRQVSKAVVN